MPRTVEPSGETAGSAVEPPAPARATRVVLVPLDGTQLAEEALAIGASLARRAGAPLHLVSAVAPVLEAVRREFPDLAEREVRDETASRKAYLEQVAEMVRAIRPGVVKVSVLSGDPGEAIASYAGARASTSSCWRPMDGDGWPGSAWEVWRTRCSSAARLRSCCST